MPAGEGYFEYPDAGVSEMPEPRNVFEWPRVQRALENTADYFFYQLPPDLRDRLEQAVLDDEYFYTQDGFVHLVDMFRSFFPNEEAVRDFIRHREGGSR